MRRFSALILLFAFAPQPVWAAPTPQRFARTTQVGVAASVAASYAAQWLQNMQMFAASVPLRPPLAVNRLSLSSRPTPPSVSQTLRRDHATVVRSGPGLRGTPPHMLSHPLLPAEAKKLGPPPKFEPVRAPMSKTRTSNIRTQSVTLGGANVTGINHWWTYEEGAIPGVGKYMANVANGNLIMQADDVDIPERGIDLAFRRTYNSFSGHDWAQTDGSETPAQYGNGWTNTFDAHIANNSSGGLSLFDIDGARYDYAYNGTGCYTAPAGQYASLCGDGGGGYLWTKKNGTVYYFWGPGYGGPSNAGYSGRLYLIWGRNHNNSVTFNYYWTNGDASSANNLTQIVAQHSDGHALTMSFSSVNGHQLLTGLARPDGVSIAYYYDTNDNLSCVIEPVNNDPYSEHCYAWNANHQLYYVTSPRWNKTGGAEGGYNWFGYYGNNQLLYAVHVGVMNFTPGDGTGVQLQSGPPTGAWQDWWETFSYGSGTTSLSDTDGHSASWYWDGSGRTTQTNESTGSTTLSTTQSWDAQNNLLSSTDPRGNETDYAYDSNGNTTAVGAPSVTMSQGTFRPTSLYSYDAYNNVTAYCDPNYTHTIGGDWVSRPGTSDSLCPSQTGATRYTWVSTASTPYSLLTDTYTPLGYHTAIGYNQTMEGGDFALPTNITPDAFTQTDGTSFGPAQYLYYGSYGTLTQYQKSISNGQLGTATFTFDSMNRVTTSTDPDGYSSCTGYFANGQVSWSETPAEHAPVGAGAQCSPSAAGQYATTELYDADGNQTSETKHFNNENGRTDKWYDGGDRLVEVGMPQNTGDYAAGRDFYSFRWMTRYIYDLSQGGTVSAFGGAVSLSPHGNLATTREYNCGAVQTYASGQPTGCSTPSWNDLKGNSYDLLDRPVTKYYYSGTAIQNDTSTYDGGGYLGLLSGSCDASSNCSAPTYDATGATVSLSFSGPVATPSRTYSLDADGRTTAIGSSTFGTQTFGYDADGKQISAVEPSGGGVTSPATLTYGYYPNGLRSTLSVSSSGLTQGNLFRYAYRNDGALSSQYFVDGAASTTLTFSRSNAGRITTRSENTAGSAPYSETLGYDAYGRVNAQSIPSGPITAFAYDAENEKTSEQVVYTNAYSYSLRGERLSSRYNTSISANGILLSTHTALGNAPDTTFNAYMGVMTAQTANANTSNQTDTTWGFDNAGRQTSTSADYIWVGNVETGTFTRTYDAENHLINQTDNGYPSQQGIRTVPLTISLGYQWGPNGHPALIGSSTSGTTSPISYSTVHWDGDQPLFVTNSSGQVEDVKIGTAADYTPLDPSYNGITFLDRTTSGVQVACHNSTGASTMNDPDEVHLSAPYACRGISAPNFTRQGQANTPLVGHSGILFSAGTDGISDGFNTIQGVRSYDPQLGSWTSPDAYPGTTHDPMSQKSYMWNKNNAIAYSDPSGYLSVLQESYLGLYISRMPRMFASNGVACTDFVLNLFKTVLNIDIRAEVRRDYFHHLIGYNNRGWSNRNYAGNVNNLHHFFNATGQSRSYNGNTRMRVGDILFIGSSKTDLHHIAMVAAVDNAGHATNIVESHGGGENDTIENVSEETFEKNMKREKVAVQDVGRDDADNGAAFDDSGEVSMGETFMNGSRN